MSSSVMASGTEVCTMKLLQNGTCTVSTPTPERRQARAASTEAPAIPCEPAISNARPKFPLWANRLRGFSKADTSSCSSRQKSVSMSCMASLLSPMSSNCHSPTYGSFSAKRNASFGSCRLSVRWAWTIFVCIL